MWSRGGGRILITPQLILKAVYVELLRFLAAGFGLVRTLRCQGFTQRLLNLICGRRLTLACRQLFFALALTICVIGQAGARWDKSA